MAAPISRRRFLRQGFAGAVMLGGGASLLGACGDDDDPSTTATTGGSGGGDFGELAIQFSWIKNIEFAGNYMADSKGYYADAGFSSVNLIPGPGDAIAPLVAGDVMYSFLGSETLAAAIINEDVPVKVIGTNFQKNPFCILYLQEDPLDSPDAMRGKTVG